MAFSQADYATLADVKQFIGGSSSTDDDLIETFIGRVSRWIDRKTGRWFYPKTQTRKFHAVDNVDHRALLLDEPLLTITTLTNGDGEVITSDEYVLEPTNSSPKAVIKLLASSGVSWTYQTDPEEAISVAGTWGMVSSTPPGGDFEDIRHAAAAMTAWQYMKRENPTADRLAMPEMGVIQIPGKMPVDVAAILGNYKRRRFGRV